MAGSASAPDRALTGDPRWVLVQRVAASATFERSRRLREFLLYVAERTLRDPGRHISEHEIRREVFGRSSDADILEDTLVRVQASQLRRRLEQYFAIEGAAETLVLEVPRGGYTPVFVERTVTRRAPATPPAPVPSGPVTSPSMRAVAAGLAALAVACVLFALDAHRSRSSAPRPVPVSSLGPSVDRLWRQMFGEGSVYVVLADTNLSLFQDTLRYQLSLSEYQRQEFVRIAAEHLPEAEVPISWRLMNRENTSIADATLATRVARVNALQARAADVVLARRADPGQLQVRNVILSGPRRSNPWVELFEPRLIFQSRFEEGRRRASLVNTAPQPGEPAEYVVEWNKVGYGRVAYLPSPEAGAGVLLLSGIDLSSTDACSDFVTNEAHVRDLLGRLGVAAGERIPYFEVLLRTTLLLGTVSQYEVVAFRVHRAR